MLCRLAFSISAEMPAAKGTSQPSTSCERPSTSRERLSVLIKAILEIDEADVASIETASGDEEDYVIPDICDFSNDDNSSDPDNFDPCLTDSDDDLEVEEKYTKNLDEVLSVPNELTGKNGFNPQLTIQI